MGLEVGWVRTPKTEKSVKNRIFQKPLKTVWKWFIIVFWVQKPLKINSRPKRASMENLCQFSKNRRKWPNFDDRIWDLRPQNWPNIGLVNQISVNYIILNHSWRFKTSFVKNERILIFLKGLDNVGIVQIGQNSPKYVLFPHNFLLGKTNGYESDLTFIMWFKPSSNGLQNPFLDI